ncbi:MAG: helix-turn-helix domain-containing protein [Cyclobacteriaceae bacterium]
MIFETHTLPESLSKYIESVFHFKDFVPDHSIERVVPTGHTFLIFELDGFVRNTFNNDTLEPNQSFTNVWISGAHKNYLSISAHQKSEMFVIQFKPFGAHPFLHFPMEKISEQVVSGEQFFGDDLINMRELLLSGATSNDKFKVAEEWLFNRFNEEKAPPAEVIEFYQQLQNNPGLNGHGKNGSYPNTQKHLIDQFKKYVGLTPKYLHRIIRFNEILQKIHKKEKVSWAQIAYECGFSDQSYFIKEFRHFSGFNPQEFIEQDFKNDETNFFPLDREG